MSELKVGDKVKTTVCDFGFPVGIIGEVSEVLPGGINITFGDSHVKWRYFPSEVEKVQTIDLTYLDAEAVEKVKEFADSLRKQATPTAENKYIWLVAGSWL